MVVDGDAAVTYVRSTRKLRGPRQRGLLYEAGRKVGVENVVEASRDGEVCAVRHGLHVLCWTEVIDVELPDRQVIRRIIANFYKINSVKRVFSPRI